MRGPDPCVYFPGVGPIGVSVLIKTSDYSMTNRNLKIAGNEVHHNGGGGIVLDAGAWNADLIVDHFWIHGNRTWENTGSGISVYANSTVLVVDGNHAWDSQDTPVQTTAVKITGTHTGAVIQQNHWFTGAVTVPAA